MNYKTNSSGKILITSEYLVLKGALALAIPTKFQQSLSFIKNDSSTLAWESYDSKNQIWFNCEFILPSLKFLKNSDENIGNSLRSILFSAKKMNPKFLNRDYSGFVNTKLEFPNNWGLGSSSTLINNIAKWANIDPYQLLWSNYKGSGYDIACAESNDPILYQLKNKKPKFERTSFNPRFSENLFFIHLNKKQNTNSEIKVFNNKKISSNLIDTFSNLTKKFLNSDDLIEFQSCIIEHEKLLSIELNSVPVKKKLFVDYLGEIKSLGAWGGDFILAAGPKNSPDYFEKKGYKTIIPFKMMLKNSN
ncbi:GYDIA family GHMP kinase [Flavobacteriaceae bacterium]|nr:GYDIA family GHMP kinase [Flavobacteriaceae bacterium]